MHMEIAGTSVSIVQGQVAGVELLDVYCDLGSWPAQLHGRLLSLNLRTTGTSFCIHPETANVICRFRIPLDPAVDGAALPAALARQIDDARASLHH